MERHSRYKDIFRHSGKSFDSLFAFGCVYVLVKLFEFFDSAAKCVFEIVVDSLNEIQS